MSRHREVQGLLYEFVTGTLTAPERRRVEEHCAECAECQSDLEGIRAVLGNLPSELPSEERSEAFWLNFQEKVARQIESPHLTHPGVWEQFFEEVKAYLTRRWKPVGVATGGLLLALVAFLVTLNLPRPAATDHPKESLTGSGDTTLVRLAQYLQKSKTLLVGVNQLKAEPGAPLDLSAERRQSRQLAMESRLLRSEPLDERSRELVGDLEKLFIELGSAGQKNHEPVLRLVRTGMEQENVLFKIRMAEAAYRSGHLRAVNHRR